MYCGCGCCRRRMTVSPEESDHTTASDTHTPNPTHKVCDNSLIFTLHQNDVISTRGWIAWRGSQSILCQLFVDTRGLQTGLAGWTTTPAMERLHFLSLSLGFHSKRLAISNAPLPWWAVIGEGRDAQTPLGLVISVQGRKMIDRTAFLIPLSYWSLAILASAAVGQIALD